ncbi:GGDEF domain-containing protein [Thermus sp. NEB1569]|uniref:GGDEF domain-containing protein n=1 Tax=Thermus sp. NEB1569 TaxID=2918899 RepID=UPI00351DDC71
MAFAASRAVGLDPVDRFFLPLLALGFSLLALALWSLPRTSSWVLPLAHGLEEHIRQSDRAVRLGGEEFAVLLAETPLAQAVRMASRLRQAVAALRVFPAEGISVSIGVAEARPEDSPLSLLKRADDALYQAKRRGKNRVEVG